MFKVVTWNVNSVKARGERLIAFLHRENPDVVCLQELKCIDEAFPYETIQSLGYHAAVFGQKAYNGVALLSREAPQNIRRGFEDGNADAAARFIGATIRGIHIYSAYIPNGQAVGSEKYAYKLEWFSRLKKYLEKNHTPSDRTLLAGDFNVAPEPRDVHDPALWEGKILFSEPERHALLQVCGTGLADTFRKHHAEGNLYSWWDYRDLGFPKNKGLRIDFILATPPLMEVCTEARIDRDERKGTLPSDHAPVIASFKLP